MSKYDEPSKLKQLAESEHFVGMWKDRPSDLAGRLRSEGWKRSTGWNKRAVLAYVLGAALFAGVLWLAAHMSSALVG